MGIMGIIGNYWELLGIIGIIGNYWELLGTMRNYREVLGIIVNYWELIRNIAKECEARESSNLCHLLGNPILYWGNLFLIIFHRIPPISSNSCNLLDKKILELLGGA